MKLFILSYLFAKDGAEYFDGGYEEFLEKIGWEDEELFEIFENLQTQIDDINDKYEQKIQSVIIM